MFNKKSYNYFFVRLRDSYKRFVKTWIRFANPWIRTVSWIMNPDLKRFVSYRGSRILTLKDSFQIVSHESSQFSKIRPFLRIQRILTNPQYYRFTNPYESLGFGFANLYGVQKIRFVDSFRTTVFKRFVSWIRFVNIFFPNYSIRFVSEGFVYESRILTFLIKK